MDQRNVLLSMIAQFLDGQWSLSEFDRQFYSYYIDELPASGGLPDEEHQFFSRVHEKLDWTGADVSTDDRRDGWINEQEFRDWLQHELRLHLVPRE